MLQTSLAVQLNISLSFRETYHFTPFILHKYSHQIEMRRKKQKAFMQIQTHFTATGNHQRAFNELKSSSIEQAFTMKKLSRKVIGNYESNFDVRNSFVISFKICLYGKRQAEDELITPATTSR